MKKIIDNLTMLLKKLVILGIIFVIVSILLLIYCKTKIVYAEEFVVEQHLLNMLKESIKTEILEYTQTEDFKKKFSSIYFINIQTGKEIIRSNPYFYTICSLDYITMFVNSIDWVSYIKTQDLENINADIYKMFDNYITKKSLYNFTMYDLFQSSKSHINLFITKTRSTSIFLMEFIKTNLFILEIQMETSMKKMQLNYLIQEIPYLISKDMCWCKIPYDNHIVANVNIATHNVIGLQSIPLKRDLICNMLDSDAIKGMLGYIEITFEKGECNIYFTMFLKKTFIY